MKKKSNAVKAKSQTVKPPGLSYKRVYSKTGEIIGYIKKRYIYHSDLRIWGSLSSDKVGKKEVRIRFNNGTIGNINANGNIFNDDLVFLGTVGLADKATFPTVCAAVSLVLFVISIFFSSYFTGLLNIPVYNPGNEKITISDEVGDTIDSKINILAYSSVAYPDSRGVYTFYISNSGNKDAVIDISFDKTDSRNIPMRYKLKVNNIFIAGSNIHWVQIHNLKYEGVTLLAGSECILTLEWNWDPDITEGVSERLRNRGISVYNLIILVESSEL